MRLELGTKILILALVFFIGFSILAIFRLYLDTLIYGILILLLSQWYTFFLVMISVYEIEKDIEKILKELERVKHSHES